MRQYRTVENDVQPISSKGTSGQKNTDDLFTEAKDKTAFVTADGARTFGVQ